MDPERPIEKQLRTYARQRGAEAGARFDLHPVVRRRLQAEVAARYGGQSRAPQRRGLFTWLAWPRLAWSAAGLATLAVVAALVWQGSRPGSAVQHRADNRVPAHPQPGDTLTAPAPTPASKPTPVAEAVNTPTPMVDAPVAAKPPAPAVAVVPTPASPAPRDAERPVPAGESPAYARRYSVAGSGAASRAPAPAPAPATAATVATVAPVASAEAMSSPTPALAVASVPRLPAPNPHPNLNPNPNPGPPTPSLAVVTVPATPSSQNAPAPSGLPRVARSDQASTPRRPSMAAASPASTLSDRIESAAAGLLHERAATEAAHRLLSFTRVSALAPAARPTVAKTSAEGTILAAFQMDRSGNGVRLIDTDGSVYTGTVQPVRPGFTPSTDAAAPGPIQGRAAATADLAPATPAPLPAGTSTASILVTGTNRTSRQKVVFQGTLSQTNRLATLRGNVRIGSRAGVALEAVEQKP